MLSGDDSSYSQSGAALNKKVEAFLHSVKFPYTVGCGMTECGPAIAFDHWRNVPSHLLRESRGPHGNHIDSPDPFNQVWKF